ncbi:MAG: signal peptidase I [Acutalibacteraceae bacterium]
MKDLTKKNKAQLTFRDKVIINVYDIMSTFAVALVTIMLLFSFVFRVVGIVGQSMENTLHDKDYVITTVYDKKPVYGQVVISTQPNAFDDPIVKRVIATENQVVDINPATGEVFVDGVLLDEPYIKNITDDTEGTSFPVTVPEDHVFLMGDNRQHSTDSRSSMIGFVHEDYLLGVVKLKVFSFDENTQRMKINPPSEWIVK